MTSFVRCYVARGDACLGDDVTASATITRAVRIHRLLSARRQQRRLTTADALIPYQLTSTARGHHLALVDITA
jgi:hypothetical protein